MSKLWICREQTARVPYRLEVPGVEISTIEELCYYLYHSMEYVDESVMEEPLFAWLSGELKLPRLAAGLREERSRGRTAFWCAWFLLKETGMYTGEELSQFQDLCMTLEQKDEGERKKLRADRMLANGRFGAAILEYQRLLLKEREKGNQELLGAICHNMGVAYAKLFLFQEAAEAFEMAYGYHQDVQSFEARREALRLLREMEEAVGEEEIAENGEAVGMETSDENRETADTEERMDERETAGFPDWDSYLRQCKKEYRKNVK